MKSVKSFLIGLAVLCLLAGMGGCESGQDPAMDGDATLTSFAMKIAGSTPAGTNALSTTATGLELTEAKLRVKEVKIDLPDSILCAEAGVVESETITCEEEIEQEGEKELVVEAEIKLRGPFVFDLIRGTVTPGLDNFSLPSGLYKKIKVSLEKDEAGVFTDVSVMAEGQYSDAEGNVTPVRFALDISEELEIENQDGMPVRENVKNQIFAAIDIATWFSGVDFEGCVSGGHVDSSGSVIEIGDDSGHNECSELDETVKENIKNSFDLEREED